MHQYTQYTTTIAGVGTYSVHTYNPCHLSSLGLLFPPRTPTHPHPHPGTDHLVKIWNTTTGECFRSLNHHSDGVTCVAWFPDNRRLVTGSADKRMVLCDINGGELASWRRRVVDLAVSHDGQRIVSIKSDRDVHIIDLTMVCSREGGVGREGKRKRGVLYVNV